VTGRGARRPRELFLSHSARDRGVATRLCDVLREHGVPVWYAPSDLIGAQQWHDEIGRALRRCDWFAVILSPSSLASMWVRRELGYALLDPRYDQRIVPILHRPCDPAKLPWTLHAMQRIDLTQGFYAGCRDLLRIWGVGYRR
jgi:hypothetical protein